MRIGFIGTGNMGKAMIEGFISSKNVKNEEIVIFDVDSKKLNELTEKFNVSVSESENEVVKNADLIK